MPRLMNRRTFLTSGLLGGAALLTRGARGRDDARPEERVDEGARDEFRAAGVDGCFVLYDIGRGRTTVVNPRLASRGFLPASTFKIPNTVIGLETGVIPNERFALEWDGVQRDFVPAWNRDHDLRSAMKNSVLWFYQEIARRIGEERYRHYLALLDYGNRDVSGGVDRFWVSGGLRITPRQQVEFLTRLMRGELPVADRSVEILRSILLTATEAGVVLRGKTGLTEQEPHKLGWLVGFVERPALSHVFACLVLGPAEQEWRESPVFRARREVPLRLLARLGAVPPTIEQPA